MRGERCGVGEVAELTTAIRGRENIGPPAVSQQEDPTNLGWFDDDALPRTRKGSGSGTSRSGYMHSGPPQTCRVVEEPVK